ncbi:MAG: hypothetical protein H8E71_03980 [Candidatus Marinimicrobia bacterium]|nr:hypothetical protein [Candidatus Neomarinimicrobiota bacterium]
MTIFFIRIFPFAITIDYIRFQFQSDDKIASGLSFNFMVFNYINSFHIFLAPVFWFVDNDYAVIENPGTELETQNKHRVLVAKGDCYCGMKKSILPGGTYNREYRLFPVTFFVVSNKNDKHLCFSISFLNVHLDINMGIMNNSWN